jgi:hypothetical protein
MLSDNYNRVKEKGACCTSLSEQLIKRTSKGSIKNSFIINFKQLPYSSYLK